MFIAALFTIAKIRKQPKCFINRGMAKEDAVNIYNGILLSHKREWNSAICSNMDGLGGYHAKWNKSGKDKYCMISLICGI